MPIALIHDLLTPARGNDFRANRRSLKAVVNSCIGFVGRYFSLGRKQIVAGTARALAQREEMPWATVGSNLAPSWRTTGATFVARRSSVL